MGLIASVTEPDIRRHLLREEGEVVVDEVRKHPVAYLRPALEALLAVVLLVAFPFVDLDLAWFPFLLAGGIAAHAGWLALHAKMDVFVITNMRVFRVHGVLSQQLATMPLSRILDITVAKPLIGRILGYGHFIFESAAQEQGLRDIRFVGRPDQRDLAIQRVVQRAGLRGPRAVN
ncbi:MAG: PH domain-containing protein [Nocardioides sp.]|nr:PH domain-containing protein [Nocardioides sp. InS609-2]MBA3783623.1 PH domain-containing protein [Nocardioides sp.]